MLRMGTALAAILGLSLALAACGEEPTPTPTPTPTATATPEAEPTPADNASGEPDSTPDDPIDLPEHIREKTAQLWEVYNHYDADGLAVFYEPSYWAEEEKEVRSNLQPFRNFGLEIRPEETSPPHGNRAEQMGDQADRTLGRRFREDGVHLRRVRGSVAAHLRGDRVAPNNGASDPTPSPGSKE